LITCGAPVFEAARMMLDQHVTFLVVVADDDKELRPIGVVTDRDIVRAPTEGRHIAARTVREVMTPEPVIASEMQELRAVLRVMQLTGLRRLPVVDANGRAMGILTYDSALVDAFDSGTQHCKQPVGSYCAVA
jgi:CBS domain-containing protein